MFRTFVNFVFAEALDFPKPDRKPVYTFTGHTGQISALLFMFLFMLSWFLFSVKIVYTFVAFSIECFYFSVHFSHFEVTYHMCSRIQGVLWNSYSFLCRWSILTCMQPNWCNFGGYRRWWCERTFMEDWPRKYGFWASRYFHDT